MTPSGRTESPRGIETNGIGKITTGHLNLTRSLEEFPDDEKRQFRWKRDPRKIPFAGLDPADRGWGP